MPVLRWIAHVYRATFWLAINLAIVAGLYLLSAHLGRQGPDSQPGLYIFRGIASLWLFAALWSWAVRGVLRRPAPVADKKKITKAEATRGTAGCLARLAVAAVAFVVLGNYAEWVYDGLIGSDPRHPARQWLDRATALATGVSEHPDVYVPYIAWLAVGAVLLYAMASFLASPRRMTAREARGASPVVARPGSTSRKHRRPDVAAANEAALAAARKHGAAAAAGSARAVGVAHEGAHRTDPAPAHPDHLFGKAERTNSGQRRGGREDAVLGALHFSSGDGVWWARRDGSDQFPVRIEAGEDGPSGSQIEIARAIVQRSFEALLRGTEAARPAALAKGVGLPRFTIATAVVGGDNGRNTPATLHLRCDGDPKTDYVVRSVDHLQTFTAA
ncbi:MAG TPA: hypothetical protein VMF13_09120 [Luteitalea sp.]|nr:hypothetical protein [Luteitalea sp.]